MAHVRKKENPDPRVWVMVKIEVINEWPSISSPCKQETRRPKKAPRGLRLLAKKFDPAKPKPATSTTVSPGGETTVTPEGREVYTPTRAETARGFSSRRDKRYNINTIYIR